MSIVSCDALSIEYDLKRRKSLKILIKAVRSKDIVIILHSVYINQKKRERESVF